MEKRETFVSGVTVEWNERWKISHITTGHRHNVWPLADSDSGQLACTCTWLWLFLLPFCFWLWLLLLLLLFGEAAQSRLTISWGRPERRGLASLSWILGFQVIFKQRLGE